MKFALLNFFLYVFSLFTAFSAFSTEVTMAFSQEIPPYIFEKENKGIEIDIISAALAIKGHTLKPVYFPLGRIPIAFKNKLVDAAMGDIGINLEQQGGHYAHPTIVYDNVFITLKSREIVIETPDDLDGLHVVSFQGAEKRYAKWLTKVTEEHRFFGISDQLSQVKLLYFGRYDVVLSDRYIFRYFSQQVKDLEILIVSEVDEHKFITENPNDYRPVFRDKTVRDDFNLGLKHIKESGQFQKIYAKYIDL